VPSAAVVPNDSARCEITATLKFTQCRLDVSISNIEKMVKDIRRNTRRTFSIEEQIRIVLDCHGAKAPALNCVARTLIN
jgi:hypothetical protein